MTTPDQVPAPALDSTTHGAILAGFFTLGQNTCQIGRALGLSEARVVEIVRAERERRVAVYAGRRER